MNMLGSYHWQPDTYKDQHNCCYVDFTNVCIRTHKSQPPSVKCKCLAESSTSEDRYISPVAHGQTLRIAIIQTIRLSGKIASTNTSNEE